MGNVLRPAFGTPDGYYCLNLKSELDRACLTKLLDLSSTIGRQRMFGSPDEGIPSQSMKLLNQDGLFGDTSQKGNWSCFRNEFYCDKAIEVSSELFIPMPQRGQLEFDFISGMRPPLDDESIHPTDDAKFLRVLGSCCLIKNDQHSRLLKEMRTIKETCRAITNVPTGAEAYHARSIVQSDQVFAAMENFYENLPNRFNSIALGGIAAEIKFDYLDVMSSINQTNGSNNGVKTILNSGRDYEATDSEEEEEEAKKKAAMKSRKSVAARSGRVSVLPKKGLSGAAEGSNANRRTIVPAGGGGGNADNRRSMAVRTKAAPEETKLVVGFATGMTPANKEDVVRNMTAETAPKYAFEETDTDVYVLKKPAGAGGGAGYRRGQVLIAPAGLSSHACDKPGMLNKQGSFKKQSGLDQLRKGSRRKSSMSEVFVKAMVKRVAYKKLLIHPAVSAHAKANRAVDQLEEALGRIWLTSAQLAMVMYAFQQGSVWKAKGFGTYRVELVVTLLHRILDLHNFDVVLHYLTSDEIACLYCRIGWLNLYNPMKPEVRKRVGCVYMHVCWQCTNVMRLFIIYCWFWLMYTVGLLQT